MNNNTMHNEKTPTPQPELYRCDCCDNYSLTSYGLSIRLDFVDGDTAEGEGERERTQRLCRHCYYKWYEGQMSTREMLHMCDHNMKRRAVELEVASQN